MIKIQDQITIQRSAEQVYGYVMDYQKLPLWQPETLEVTMQEGKTGTRNKARGWAGLTMEVNMEPIEILPNRRAAFRVDEVHGLLDGQVRWDFEPRGDSTQVICSQKVKLHKWLRLIGPVFTSGARRKVAKDLIRLKGQLEAS